MDFWKDRKIVAYKQLTFFLRPRPNTPYSSKKELSLTKLKYIRGGGIALILGVLLCAPFEHAFGWVCQAWTADWQMHVGILPNSTRSPAAGDENFQTTFWVTADFGFGPNTLSGDAWCGMSGSSMPSGPNEMGPHCYCKIRAANLNKEWLMRGFFNDMGEAANQSCKKYCASLCAGCIIGDWNASCEYWRRDNLI